MHTPANHRGFTHVLVLGLVALGALTLAYGATSGDFAYNAQALVAQVTATVDTTPRIVISRGFTSPSTATWPLQDTVVGIFDVKPKYLTSYGYLRRVVANVSTNNNSAGLRLGNFKMRYDYCVNTVCKNINVNPSSVTSSPRSAGGTTYQISAYDQLYLPVYVNQPAGQLVVSAYPYYANVFNSLSSTANIKADIASAIGTGKVCGSSFSSASPCSFGTVPVYTRLAYGSWRTVLRGTGYGYGYYDYTQNGALNQLDVDLLLKVVVNSISCPVFKVCNVDGKLNAITGKPVDATDALLLAKYANGTLPPPGTATTSKTGIGVTFVSANTTANVSDGANNDQGVFQIKYKITAVNGDVYIPSKTDVLSSGSTIISKTIISVDRNGVSAQSTGIVSTLQNSTDPAMTPAGSYLIKAGQSENFVVTTTVQLPAAGSAGQYRMAIAGIGWGSADSVLLNNSYSGDLSTLTTSYLSLN